MTKQMAQKFREQLGFQAQVHLYRPGNALEESLGFFADDRHRPVAVTKPLYELVRTLHARSYGLLRIANRPAIAKTLR